MGIGAGFGTAAYMKGEFSKTYPYGYHETVKAVIETLDELKIPVTEKLSDELKWEFGTKEFQHKFKVL